MSTPISQVTYSNTFTQWLNATNGTITEVNNIALSTYYKTGGTFYFNSPGIGLYCSNNATFTGNVIVTGATTNYFQLDIPLKLTSSISANGYGLSNLNAANIAFGTVPTARLGSATANNLTFLRGDNTWAIPPYAITLISDNATNYNYPVILANTTSGALSQLYDANNTVLVNPSTGTLKAQIINAANNIITNDILLNTANSHIIKANNIITPNATIGTTSTSTLVTNITVANTANIAILASNNIIGQYIQVGNNSISTNNFVIYQPAAPDTTLRIGNGNYSAPKSVITINANGAISFGAAGNYGTANQVLISNSVGAPIWQSLSNTFIAPGNANTSSFLRGDMTWQNVNQGTVLSQDNTTNYNYQLPLANTISGVWTAGYVANSSLYFNPSTGTLNATNFNSLSDLKYKSNVEIIVGVTSNTHANTIGIIQQLDGVTFDWISTGRQSAGVIAQNLELVLPNLVSSSGDDKSVNYSGLIGYLISAVKDLDTRINRAGL